MRASVTVDDARRILIDHPLPKARQRTNVWIDAYISQGRLFGAFTTRAEGITQATFRFLWQLLRLCAWLGLSNFEGGRLWVESHIIGTYPPPNATELWHHNLRGDYHNVRNAWVKFNPRCYHAVEPVTKDRRVS